MLNFVITNQRGSYLKTSIAGTQWFIDPTNANKYSSKYAAKQHLKQLDNMPEGVNIKELLTEKGEV